MCVRVSVLSSPSLSLPLATVETTDEETGSNPPESPLKLSILLCDVACIDDAERSACCETRSVDGLTKGGLGVKSACAY